MLQRPDPKYRGGKKESLSCGPWRIQGRSNDVAVTQSADCCHFQTGWFSFLLSCFLFFFFQRAPNPYLNVKSHFLHISTNESGLSLGAWAFKPVCLALLPISCWLLSHAWLWDPIGWSLPGSPVHEVLQARILEWVAIPFSPGSSQPRDSTRVSCNAARFFIIWATREAPCTFPDKTKTFLRFFVNICFT